MCVWVMKMASKSAGANPRACRPRVIRRQEMPASTKRCVSPQEMTSAFPEEPLARVCNVVKLRYLAIPDRGISNARGEGDESRQPPSRALIVSISGDELSADIGFQIDVGFFHGLDVRTQCLQFGDNVLIAPLDVVNLGDLTAPLGG